MRRTKMVEWTDELNKQYRTTLFIAIALLIAAPLVYLNIGYILSQERDIISNEPHRITYILLFLSIFQPLIIPFLVKSFISVYHKKPSKFKPKSGFPINLPLNERGKEGSPMGLFMQLVIVKSALIEASYIYGLVSFFLSGNITYMLYFYPIGIIWTIIHFPRKSHYEDLVRKVEEYAPTD